jgi:hypothetical protein
MAANRPTDDELDRVSALGRAAWQRLKKDKSWSDWMAVGEALKIGRQIAMHAANTEEPQGRRYNEIFGEWLIKYRLNDMDKSDRAKLFAVMEHRREIDSWRESLPTHERLKLNHPASVLRSWRTATKVSDHQPPGPSPAERRQQEKEDLLRELDDAHAEVRELKAIQRSGAIEREIEKISQLPKAERTAKVVNLIDDVLGRTGLTLSEFIEAALPRA